MCVFWDCFYDDVLFFGCLKLIYVNKAKIGACKDLYLLCFNLGLITFVLLNK